MAKAVWVRSATRPARKKLARPQSIIATMTTARKLSRPVNGMRDTVNGASWAAAGAASMTSSRTARVMRMRGAAAPPDP